MKRKALILAIFALISHSLSAQSIQELKSDSIKIGFNFYQQILNDTLKLNVPPEGENRQFHFRKMSCKTKILRKFTARDL